MGQIQVLDCTLRDGGYCNEWRFGFENTKKIVSGLIESGIEITECGFLTNTVDYNRDVTKFCNLNQICNILANKHSNQMYVCMMNYGEYDVECIPNYDGSSVDGIRVAFHKKNMIEALEICKSIQEKGYKVFIQAMVSLNYNDIEFLDLIHRVNKIKPYSFYIVDSFGVMKKKDLVRLFYLVDHNLDDGILIGFHSHNNMQLSYSNAQALADIHTDRGIIIDSSIYGMGRGAGNLNSELFVEYLNDNFSTNYQLKPLLSIIDDILNTFYQQNCWGYSLPNYLSAKHNAHPNYASYLDSKKTLTVEAMDEIFTIMDDSKRVTFDKAYIEDLYTQYMAKSVVQEVHLYDLKQQLSGREVLIIAPGPSAADEKDKIIAFSNSHDIVSISINFDYQEMNVNYIFSSNLRRFRKIPYNQHSKCIITSNIAAVDVYLQIGYSDLINQEYAVHDNAGLMLIKFLVRLGIKKIYIAGMDGYSIDPMQNYADQKMVFYTHRAITESMNEGINNMLRIFSTQVDIEFITTKNLYLYKD